jgi:hypothetical protein
MILYAVLGKGHEVRIKHSQVFHKFNISLGIHALEERSKSVYTALRFC